MAININTLDTERKTVAEGLHLAEICSVKKRTNKNDPDKEHLNICFKTTTGTFFDTISESEENLAQYKLSQLLKATGALETLTGEVELDDIQRAITGKTVGVFVIIKEQDNGYGPRAEIDINTDMYLTPEEYEEYQAAAQDDTV